jgi:predicted amidohydrolase
MSKTFTLGLVQMAMEADYEANLAKAESMIAQARATDNAG